MTKERTKAPRKAYTKPMIAVEDFTLNQFIASCTIKTRNNPQWQEDLQTHSPFHYFQVTLGYFGDPVGCVLDVEDDADTGNMDGMCYHTSTSPLFTS